MILKVRKDFMVLKQRDFIAKWSWFTVVDFHTLEAMFLLTCTKENEAAIVTVLWTWDFLARSTLPESINKLISGEKKGSKYFRKLFVAAS